MDLLFDKLSIMNLSVGIVGLPNVGKSTLFNALLKKQIAQSANYPFTTIEPNVGVVEVPDARLEKLKDIVERSEGLNPGFKIIPAVVKFVDIAGLVKGAAEGEGLGNQFLSHIREVDAIVFVLRDFKNEDVIRSGSVDPKSDLEVLKAELLLKDLETLSKRIDSLSAEAKSKPANDPSHQTLAILAKSKQLIEQGNWLAPTPDGAGFLNEEELEKIADLQLLSTKKVIYVLNSDEADLGVEPLREAIRISAKLEEELASLSEEEQREYLSQLGVAESGLERLIKKAYETLGLVTFLTAGPKEVRAWTIKKGILAPAAAGVIHTDFERGFIAADVIDFQNFIDGGGWKEARAKGKVSTIGKNDEIKDGMVVEFKFSV